MPSFRPAPWLALLTFAFAPAAFAQSSPGSSDSRSAKPHEQTSPPAPADSAKQEAARRFEHAIKLYEDADYTLALAEFERVYELVPDYRVLYNIGQVSIQLGRYARAFRTLKEYVDRGGAELPADRQKAVQADSELLAGRVATVAISVDQPGAEIAVDGAVVGTSPLAEPLIVDVGERNVHIRLTGYVAQSVNLTLAGGDRRESRFTLVREESAAPLATSTPADLPHPAQPSDTANNRHGSRTWIGWTATGALTAGALVAGALGASAAGDLKTLRGTIGATRSELDATKKRAETRLLVADMLAASALLSGGVTLYFQLKGSPRGAEAQTARPLKLVLTASTLSLVLEN